MDDGLESDERHPAFDLRASRTSATENFLSGAEIDAVKALRTALGGNPSEDMDTAISAID